MNNGNGKRTEFFWRTIALILLTVLLTGMGSWLLIVKDTLTRGEAAELFRVSSPYLKDQRMIMSGLDEIKELRKEISEIKAEIKVLSAMLDDIMRNHRELVSVKFLLENTRKELATVEGRIAILEKKGKP